MHQSKDCVLEIRLLNDRLVSTAWGNFPQTLRALLKKTVPPLGHGVPVSPQRERNCFVLLALRRREHYPAAQGDLLWCAMSGPPPCQFMAFFIGQRDSNTAPRHVENLNQLPTSCHCLLIRVVGDRRMLA
jgi:hypothetical protein